MKTGFEQWKRLSPQRQNRLDAAVSEYFGRRQRHAHPAGEWDNAGRWYPSEDEHQECCRCIRYPSRRFPHSLNKHCRSLQHIALMYRVDLKYLRRHARQLRDLAGADFRESIRENEQVSNIASLPWADTSIEEIDRLIKDIEKLIKS